MNRSIEFNKESYISGMKTICTIVGALDISEISESSVNPTKNPFYTESSSCLVVLNGQISVRINLRECTIKSSEICIILGGDIVECMGCSDDFKAIFIRMEKQFTDNLNIPESISTFLSIKKMPVLELSPSQMKAIDLYCAMIQGVTTSSIPSYRIEMVKHLTIAFFYGLGSDIHLNERNENIDRGGVIAEAFLNTVRQKFRKERMVSYYADKMCISPKYLSQVVKAATGKTANEWINEHVIQAAKAMLKSTNMTIQQISLDLNFPSQSFFGKYFKNYTGYSPKSYREER